MTEARIQKIEDILSERTRHLAVVLENIYHPHNASAIIRNCDCFGIQDMHIIENRFDYTPNTDVARGAKKWVDLHYYNSSKNPTMDCINELKKNGYKIAATSLREDTVDIKDLPVDEKIALIMGTEDTGASQDMLDNADYTVKIPMYGFTQSLNVSVSNSICLHEMTGKLRQSDIDWHLSEDDKNELRLAWYKQSVRSLEHLLKRYEENKKG